MNIEQKQRFGELSAKVIEWAEARNIIKGATQVSQFAKLISEFGEFGRNIIKLGTFEGPEPKDVDAVMDDIGDQVVVLTIIGAQMEAYLVDSLESLDGEELAPDYAALQLIGVYGAMADNILKGQLEQFEANVEKAFRLLSVSANWIGSSLDECLAAAYEDIKDRKGVMYNGTFVKSTDAAYPGICAELGLEG